MKFLGYFLRFVKIVFIKIWIIFAEFFIQLRIKTYFTSKTKYGFLYSGLSRV